MANCDLFDIALHDQFQTRGYQRRVFMRGSWASLRVQHAPLDTPIKEIRLAADAVPRFVDVVVGRYRDAPFWKARHEQVIGLIEAAPREYLWSFNVDLIQGVKAMLLISTPLGLADPPEGDGPTMRLLDLCWQYRADEYLSGGGARVYLDTAAWRSVPGAPRLLWSRHDPAHGESILTSLFDNPEPLADVLRTVGA